MYDWGLGPIISTIKVRKGPSYKASGRCAIVK
jgi:hypothetical protein